LVRAGRASAPCLACGSMASPGTSRRTMLASSRYSELPSTQVLERSSLFALRGPCARTRRLTPQVASRPEAQSACWAAAWIVLIAVTGQAIYHMPRECTSAGHLYIATVAGLLACFVVGFCLECLLIWESCQGARRALLRALPVLRRLGARACGRAQGASSRCPSGGACRCSSRCAWPTPRARSRLQVGPAAPDGRPARL